jgi:predicted GIY-YIG superfamily endonuclease
MPANVRVEVHAAEVRRLLQGEGEYHGVTVDLERRGAAIAAAAGPGFTVRSFAGHDRHRVHVGAETEEALIRESRDRVLERSIDAGR